MPISKKPEITRAKSRRRSKYKLSDLLKNYVKPPKSLYFAPVGRER